MSSWTDDRVKILKDMWKSGKTSTEIAEELGGVTRNAVIGKAHRLGLSGQQNTKKSSSKKSKSKSSSKKTKSTSKKSKSTSTSKKKSTSKKSTKKKSSSKKSKKPKTTVLKKAASNTSDEPKEKSVRRTAQEAAVPKQIDPVEITAIDQKKLEDGDIISILDLTERVCRWPLGDPKKEIFGFCGEDSIEGQPYCPEHMAMAFQKSKRKKSTMSKEERLKALREKAKAQSEDAEDEDIDNDDIEDIDLDTIDDIDEDKVGMGDIEEEAV